MKNNCYNTFLETCPLCRENLGFSQERTIRYTKLKYVRSISLI